MSIFAPTWSIWESPRKPLLLARVGNGFHLISPLFYSVSAVFTFDVQSLKDDDAVRRLNEAFELCLQVAVSWSTSRKPVSISALKRSSVVLNDRVSSDTLTPTFSDDPHSSTKRETASG